MNTLFDKIWDAHVVQQVPDGPTQLYIDRLYCHEVTSPQAFDGMRARGLKCFRPAQIYCMPDHNTPTHDQDKPIALPGMTIVCGDSHTSTHGAMGAVAFGIGTSEVEMVMASQCILQQKPKSMRITINGQLGKGVTAKDVALYLMAQLTTSGATGYFVEYAGDVITALSMEGRLTLCNLSIEMGARGGFIAPDETTFAYLQGETTGTRRWHIGRRFRADPTPCLIRNSPSTPLTLNPVSPMAPTRAWVSASLLRSLLPNPLS